MFTFDLTKKGFDVFDAGLTPNDYIFSIRHNTFKILAQGTFLNRTVDTNPKTFTLAHNMGRVPGFYGYCQFPSGRIALPTSLAYSGTGTSPGTTYGQFDMGADDTYLYFFLSKPGSSYTVNLVYRIFEVPLV